jgi:hypothetical protein
MRKILTTLAVTAAAFTVPMLASGTAYADTSLQSVDGSALTNIVTSAIGGGCTTTYVSQVESQGIGTLYNVTGLTVTVYGGAPVTYAGAQESHTFAFEACAV